MHNILHRDTFMDNQNLKLDNTTVLDRKEIEPQHIISVSKFIILSVLTFGIYEVWWMYKAWKFFKQRDMDDSTPAARAIFWIFFLTPLLEDIKKFAKENNYTKSYPSTKLSIGFFVFTIAARLPDPYWLISIFSFMFLIPAFTAFNHARINSPNIESINQSSFSGKQFILIVIGAICWLLVLSVLLKG